jgi:single-stranded DNA-binding protein
MAIASVAVSVSRSNDVEDVEWISLVAFGNLAQVLLKHDKGDTASFSGQMTRRRYETRDGKEKVGWSLTVDSIVSARAVRPGGQRKKPAAARAPACNGRTMPDDEIPF